MPKPKPTPVGRVDWSRFWREAHVAHAFQYPHRFWAGSEAGTFDMQPAMLTSVPDPSVATLAWAQTGLGLATSKAA